MKSRPQFLFRWLPFASLVVGIVKLGIPTAAGETVSRHATDLRVTILSTMLAGDPLYRGIGEWGFAALVEVDDRRILFDTGLRSDTVLLNARELGIDLSNVEEVVLSHHHDDHVGGLLALRRAFVKEHPDAMSRAHVARGIFWSRRASDSRETNPMVALRTDFEETGGIWLEHDSPAEIAPGVWFTGPVPRQHAERNWSPSGQVKTPQGWSEDNIPESASLVFDTASGLVVLSGCGHAGIVNTVARAREIASPAPLLALVGGFHLLSASDDHLAWTADMLRTFEMRSFLGAHCTGIEATYRIRDLAGLDRSTGSVAAVGATFDLQNGIRPGVLAK